MMHVNLEEINFLKESSVNNNKDTKDLYTFDRDVDIDRYYYSYCRSTSAYLLT